MVPLANTVCGKYDNIIIYPLNSSFCSKLCFSTWYEKDYVHKIFTLGVGVLLCVFMFHLWHYIKPVLVRFVPNEITLGGAQAFCYLTSSFREGISFCLDFLRCPLLTSTHSIKPANFVQPCVYYLWQNGFQVAGTSAHIWRITTVLSILLPNKPFYFPTNLKNIKTWHNKYLDTWALVDCAEFFVSKPKPPTAQLCA